MPFVPLSPEEKEQFKPPCVDPQHSPGTMMMVVTSPMKWVCPSCGASIVIYPNTVRC